MSYVTLFAQKSSSNEKRRRDRVQMMTQSSCGENQFPYFLIVASRTSCGEDMAQATQPSVNDIR